MTEKILFDQFSVGALRLPDKEITFADIKWTEHPVFDGVDLKNIVVAEQTGGLFSYHLVRIAPNKKIGLHLHENQLETHEVVAGTGVCINNGVEIRYRSGIISIFPEQTHHEIIAGSEGLYLLAKFFPALC